MQTSLAPAACQPKEESVLIIQFENESENIHRTMGIVDNAEVIN